MKTKLQILLAALSILFSLASASAQQPQPAPVNPPQPTPINPQTGLPEPPPPAVDPATGLPADGSAPFHGPLNPQTGLPEGNSTGAPSWIDPAWTDPDKVLPSVEFISIPLSEVARYMRDQFTNYFDVILPGDSGAIDPTQVNIQLQLKNVTASEIFSAMNMQFELDKSPLRWELTVNGSRPTALLRYLPQLVPAAPKIRKVFFVGNIIDQYPGKDDGAKLAEVADVIHTCAGGTMVITVNMYPPGQMLIISGPPDQVDLAEQTLRALKDKALYEKSLQDEKAAQSK